MRRPTKHSRSTASVRITNRPAVGDINPKNRLVFINSKGSVSLRPETCQQATEILHKYGFTNREQEIVQALLTALPNEKIMDLLHISPNTLKTHLRHILQKAGVTNRQALLARIAEDVESAD